jgi:hypothetical protein
MHIRPLHPVYRVRQILPYLESFLAGFGAGVLLVLMTHGVWHG